MLKIFIQIDGISARDTHQINITTLQSITLPHLKARTLGDSAEVIKSTTVASAILMGPNTSNKVAVSLTHVGYQDHLSPHSFRNMDKIILA